MVVGKNGADRDLQAGGFETLKELLRPGNAAEGGNRPVNWRDVHAAAQAPDDSLPGPGSQPIFNVGFVCGNRNYVGTLGCAQWLAKISCGQQMVSKIAAAQEQNVDIAGKLAVLKAIVKQMQTRR